MVERNWDDTDIEDNDVIPTDQWIAHINDQKRHSGRHEESGSDSITVENLATNGAVGTVPTSQGDGTLAPETIETHWSEDANSPQTVTGSRSVTINLAETYDEVLVSVLIRNAIGGTVATPHKLTLNGNTNSVYDRVDVDGSVTTGITNIDFGNQNISDTYRVFGSFIISGRFESSNANIRPIGGGVADRSGTDIGGSLSFAEADVTSPLNSVTISNDNFDFDMVLQVKGRNIN